MFKTGEKIRIMIAILILLSINIYLLTEERTRPKEEPVTVAWDAEDFMKTIKGGQ